jgi:hypothetical protein
MRLPHRIYQLLGTRQNVHFVEVVLAEWANAVSLTVLLEA